MTVADAAEAMQAWFAARLVALAVGDKVVVADERSARLRLKEIFLADTDTGAGTDATVAADERLPVAEPAAVVANVLAVGPEGDAVRVPALRIRWRPSMPRNSLSLYI